MGEAPEDSEWLVRTHPLSPGSTDEGFPIPFSVAAPTDPGPSARRTGVASVWETASCTSADSSPVTVSLESKSPSGPNAQGPLGADGYGSRREDHTIPRDSRSRPSPQPLEGADDS